MYFLRTAPVGFRSLICTQLAQLSKNEDDRFRARALLASGICHLQELHPEFNIDAGVRLLAESAEMGDASAQSLLACLRVQDARYPWNDWLVNAIRNGSVNAAMQLQKANPTLFEAELSRMKSDRNTVARQIAQHPETLRDTNSIQLIHTLDQYSQDMLFRKGVQACHWAAFLGHLDECVNADELKAQVHSISSLKETPLHYAAISANIEAATFLLHYGADVNARTKFGATPLHYALLCLSPKGMVELLLTNGADANVLSESSLSDQPKRADCFRLGVGSPLHFAVLFEDVDLVALLLHAGANPNLKNAAGVTPLQYALQARDLRMLELMLPFTIQDEASLPDIHNLYPFLTGYFLTPLQKLVYWRGNPMAYLLDAIELLERHGLYIDDRGMLSWALDSDNADIADFYITKLGLDTGRTVQPWRTLPYNHGPEDVSVEVYYYDLPTMLAVVALACGTAVVKVVAKYIQGPLPPWGNQGWPYLTCVANRKSTSPSEAMAIIDTLLECGARFDVLDISGHGPLHSATASNNHEILDVLLARDPSIDDVRAAFELCIHKSHSRAASTMIYSILSKCPQVLLTPLQDLSRPFSSTTAPAGPNLNYLKMLAGAQEYTRDEVLNEYILRSVIAALKDMGREGLQALSDRVQQNTANNCSPLHEAARTGNKRAATIMVEQGADINGYVANHLEQLLGPPPPEFDNCQVLEDPFLQAIQAGPTPLDCALNRDWFLTLFRYIGKYQTTVRDLFYAGGTYLEQAAYDRRTQDVVQYLRSTDAKTKWELFSVPQPPPTSQQSRNTASHRQKYIDSTTVQPSSDTETQIFKFFGKASALPVANMMMARCPDLIMKVDTKRTCFSTLFIEASARFEQLFARHWTEEESELKLALEEVSKQYHAWSEKHGAAQGLLNPIADFPFQSLVLAAALRFCLAEISAALGHMKELLELKPRPV